MWHHAQYRGEELIVLGHNPRNNDCMLVRLSGLPMNEQSELRKIAASRSAQESSYLIPILRHQESPQGNDWFSYLCKKMEQRQSPVFVLPIKEVQDSLDPDQKAIFKGYGKGRKNQSLDVDDMRGGFGGELEPYVPEVEATPIVEKSSALEQKIDTLTQSTHQTNALLSKLVDVMLADKQPAAVKKATARKAPRLKPDSKLGHNQGPPLE